MTKLTADYYECYTTPWFPTCHGDDDNNDEMVGFVVWSQNICSKRVTQKQRTSSSPSERVTWLRQWSLMELLLTRSSFPRVAPGKTRQSVRPNTPPLVAGRGSWVGSPGNPISRVGRGGFLAMCQDELVEGASQGWLSSSVPYLSGRPSASCSKSALTVVAALVNTATWRSKYEMW